MHDYFLFNINGTFPKENLLKLDVSTLHVSVFYLGYVLLIVVSEIEKIVFFIAFPPAPVLSYKALALDFLDFFLSIRDKMHISITL